MLSERFPSRRWRFDRMPAYTELNVVVGCSQLPKPSLGLYGISDGQSNWVISMDTHHCDIDGLLLWRTDGARAAGSSGWATNEPVWCRMVEGLTEIGFP